MLPHSRRALDMGIQPMGMSWEYDGYGYGNTWDYEGIWRKRTLTIPS